MKNRTSDVRDHLVAMLEALGDDKLCNAETIERAKASAAVAAAFTASVKTDLDALRLADEIGVLVPGVAPAAQIKLVHSKAAGQ